MSPKSLSLILPMALVSEPILAGDDVEHVDCTDTIGVSLTNIHDELGNVLSCYPELDDSHVAPPPSYEGYVTIEDPSTYQALDGTTTWPGCDSSESSWFPSSATGETMIHCDYPYNPTENGVKLGPTSAYDIITYRSDASGLGDPLNAFFVGTYSPNLDLCLGNRTDIATNWNDVIKSDCYPLRTEAINGYYLISSVNRSAQGEFWGTCKANIYSNVDPMMACHGIISADSVRYDRIIEIDDIEGEQINTFFPVELPDGTISALMVTGVWYNIKNTKLINFDKDDPNSFTTIATLNGEQLTSGMDYKSDDCSINIAMGESEPIGMVSISKFDGCSEIPDTGDSSDTGSVIDTGDSGDTGSVIDTGDTGKDSDPDTDAEDSGSTDSPGTIHDDEDTAKNKECGCNDSKNEPSQAALLLPVLVLAVNRRRKNT